MPQQSLSHVNIFWHVPTAYSNLLIKEKLTNINYANKHRFTESPNITFKNQIKWLDHSVINYPVSWHFETLSGNEVLSTIYHKHAVVSRITSVNLMLKSTIKHGFPAFVRRCCAWKHDDRVLEKPTSCWESWSISQAHTVEQSAWDRPVTEHMWAATDGLYFQTSMNTIWHWYGVLMILALLQMLRVAYSLNYKVGQINVPIS